jgi:hypothetical protein
MTNTTVRLRVVIVILKNYSARRNDAPVMMVTGTEGQGLPIAIGGEPTAQIAFVFSDLGSKLEREQASGIHSRF